MTQVRAIPAGLHTVTPQIVVDGAAEAIELFKKAFGAVEQQRAADPTGKKIWHAHLKIGDSAIFVNDPFAEQDADKQARPVRLWLYLEDVDAAFRRAIDAGLRAAMAPADMFWGDRTAQVGDRFGNVWTLAQHIKDMTPAEMKAAQEAFIASLAH